MAATGILAADCGFMVLFAVGWVVLVGGAVSFLPALHAALLHLPHARARPHSQGHSGRGHSGAAVVEFAVSYLLVHFSIAVVF